MLAAFLVVALFLAATGGFLAAADSAFSALSRGDLLELAGRSRAKISLRAIADDPVAHLNAANFSRVVAETAAAVLVTLAFAIVFGEQWWWTLLVAVLVMTGVSFVLVGSSPRSVGRAHARGVAAIAALPVRFLRVLLGFIANALVWIGNRVTPGRPRRATFNSEEQLLSMVDEAADAEILEEEDRELIHSVFEFGEAVVRELMVPRTDMVTIAAEATVNEAVQRFLASGVSRVPVEGDGVDDVRGVLYLRDAVRLAHEQPDKSTSMRVAELAREAMFIPESKKADDTLRLMQVEATHLAIVIDEYGGVAGLVTLEDLIEELVGEISDEHDQALSEIARLGDGAYRISARLPTDELGELFDVDLEDEDVDSVGGLLVKALGRLAEPGDVVVVSGIQLRAEWVEGLRKRLRTIIARRIEQPADEQDIGQPRRDQRKSAAEQRKADAEQLRPIGDDV